MSTTKINLNKEIIALFSGQASILTTPKLYVQLTGNHSLAIVLSQIVFWSNKSKLKDNWFYKPYEEWFDEILMPERTLRRRFDKLESKDLILTKVKKINGLNIKHIKPNMDKIIELISIMLDQNCPNRPLCPNEENKGLSTCTKVAPIGQLGRSESATLSGSSIYTEENLHKNTTNCESSSSFYFSETLDKNLLNQKLFSDERSDSEFMFEVIEHIDFFSDLKYSRIVRAQAALKMLIKLKSQNIIFRVSGKASATVKPKIQETEKERMNRLFIENELDKERSEPGSSRFLKEHPEFMLVKQG